MFAECRPEQVLIKSDGSLVRFSVEVAETAEERGIGLMNRDTLAFSAGMLFVFERPQSVSFWMRNTLIPLDMIFLDASGTVARIHSNAVPLDETPIHGGDNIQYVLEINGGLSEQLGLKVGDTLQHPTVLQMIAAFPCES